MPGRAGTPLVPAPGALLALLALFAGAVYLPGLPGSFVLDDLHNITLNPYAAMVRLDRESLQAAFHADPFAQGWPSRGVAHLSFALNHLASGGRFDPGAVKSTNIAIHLINGILVYLLLRLVLQARAADEGARRSARWIAAVAAGIWLLHPLQLTSVLYAVQRMTSLAALFTLLGLLAYCAGRQRLERHPASGLAMMAAGIAGGTLLGVLSKENAVLTPLFALLLELWCFSLPGRASAAARRRVAAFHGAAVALPAVAGSALLALQWERLLEGYAYRSFDLLDRLLTQGRVLWYYVRLFVLPRTRDLSLFHDDIPVSTGLFTPWTTAPALLGLAVVLALCVAGFRRRSLPALCALWFLAGHLVESTVVPLEIAFEHRNYLPLVGLCLLPAWLLVRAVEARRLELRAAAALAGATMLMLGFATATRAAIWEDEGTLSYFLARNHPDSYRAHTEHARVLVARGADVRETYAALTRAATREAKPVLVLLEMVKVTREMEILIDAGSLAEESGSPPAPSGIDAPLRFHRAYLGRLRALLIATLEQRLAAQPLSHETARALVLLTECSLEGHAACVALRAEAVRWHRLALDNPRYVAETMASVELSYAALLSDEGRHEEAAAFAARAWERRPREIGFAFYQAMYLLRAGRLEEVRGVLERLEAIHRRNGRRGEDVSELRRAYEEARLAAQPRR